jgi:hypothetical protein
MKKNLLIFLSTFIVSASLYGQVMSHRVYQRDSSMAYGGQQTTDGGYIMGGLASVNPTNVDFLAVKTNALGDTLWTKTYGGIGDEESYGMQQTTDGGYIFIGIDSSSGLGNYNVFAVKTDANGDTLWTKSYGGNSYDFGQAVQQTVDGGYIIAGYTGSFGAGDADVYLLKITANGTLSWSKTYGGVYGDKAWSVKQTADGGYIMAGNTSSFGVTPNGNANDLFLLKTDASGTLTWSKTYGKDGDDWGYGVAQTYDGGYAVTGLSTKGSTDLGSEVLFMKTDAIGDTVFTKSFGGTNYDQGLAIIQTNDSGLAIGGQASSFGNGLGDLYLIKTDKTGNLIFNATFGGNSIDWTNTICQTADSGFALMGYTNGFGVDSSSFYLVKTDKTGNSYSCYQTNPTPTIIKGIAIISNAAAITNTPATLTANKTNAIIKSGVVIINPCPTAGIKQATNNMRLFTVYPNPSNGNLNIKTDDLKENTQLIIYNQLGQVVLKTVLTNQFTNINLNVNAGVYQVRILNGGELIYQTKIIKE